MVEANEQFSVVGGAIFGFGISALKVQLFRKPSAVGRELAELKEKLALLTGGTGGTGGTAPSASTVDKREAVHLKKCLVDVWCNVSYCFCYTALWSWDVLSINHVACCGMLLKWRSRFWNGSISLHVGRFASSNCSLRPFTSEHRLGDMIAWNLAGEFPHNLQHPKNPNKSVDIRGESSNQASKHQASRWRWSLI